MTNQSLSHKRSRDIMSGAFANKRIKMAKDKSDKNTKDFVDDDKSILSAGAALAAKRVTVKKKCEVCGKSFVGLPIKLTCSVKCRTRKSRSEKNK